MVAGCFLTIQHSHWVVDLIEWGWGRYGRFPKRNLPSRARRGVRLRPYLLNKAGGLPRLKLTAVAAQPDWRV